MASLLFEEDVDLRAKDIRTTVDQRFWCWLLTKNIKANESFSDGVFSEHDFIPDDIALDNSSRRNGQRLLLDVEKEGVLRRAESKMNEKRLQDKANILLAKNMRKFIASRLNRPGNELLLSVNMPAAAGDLLNTLFSPAGNYRTLSSISEQIPGLPKKIVSLVNNSEFCDTIGKDIKLIKDPQVALGVIGSVGCKFILPMMLFKPLLKHPCQFFPYLTPKIWSHAIAKANATTALLEMREQNKRRQRSNEPYIEGFLAGVFSALPTALMQHEFNSAFDEVKKELLIKLRERQERDLYNAMYSADASSRLMLELVTEFHYPLLEKINQAFSWSDRLAHIKQAIHEEATHVPYEERSAVGQALYEGDTFSRFEVMRKGNNFTAKEHVKKYLESGHLDNTKVKRLLSIDVQRVDIQRYQE
jgi:hypothetical protein